MRALSRSPRPALRALALLAVAALLPACAKHPDPPNVLLIVVDTLRPDRMSAYGYERETTPNLDALAANGIRFTHAQSPRAKTTPSVASMLTGLYPQDHGVRDLTTPLAKRVPTLAELLGKKSYTTGAIIGNYVLQRERSGLDRGFDLWVEDLPQTQGVPPDDVPQRTAKSLTDGAFIALGLDAPAAGASERSIVEPDRPWFLWLHYMDPHGLYDPPEEHRAFTSTPAPIPADDAPALPPGREERIATYNVPADAWLDDGRVDSNRVLDRYDGEIRFVDAEIGRLLDRLRAAGLLDDTWVVFLSDHGESLGEHSYYFEHGLYAYEATCRVPLILHPPLAMEDRPAPAVRRSDIALADLLPTILELCHVRGAPKHRTSGPVGLSRADLVFDESVRRHPVFSEKVERAEKTRAVQTKAVRIGDWKLISRYAQRVSRDRPSDPEMALIERELFDLSKDPREEQNLISEPPEDAPLADLVEALAAFLAADEDFEDLARILQEEREALSRRDPEALRKLEALGY